MSADVMRWQLNTVVDEEPYLDYTFPLQQMNGVNVSVVEALTVRHPLATEKDAVNLGPLIEQLAPIAITAVTMQLGRLRRTGDEGSGRFLAGAGDDLRTWRQP